MNKTQQIADSEQTNSAYSRTTIASLSSRKTSQPSKQTTKQESFIKEELLELYTFSLDKAVFQNLIGGEVTEELRESFVYLPKFTHGKTIQPGEPYFRCLDCEVLRGTNQKTYLCRTCFEKRNHKGHRFLLFNDATGVETCDCGNESLLDPRYFCPDHGTCHKDDAMRMIQALPPDFLKNFNKMLKRTIYELVFACEVHRRGIQSNIRNALNKAMDATLQAFNYCLNLNQCFIVVISEILTHNFKHPKTFKGPLFLNERSAKANPSFVEEHVGTTYLEAIMKCSPFFKEETQKNFREFLLKLACAEEFKKKLVLSFHNIVHHLFKVKPQTPFSFSNLAYLTVQVYASEENCLKVIQEGSFDKIIDVLKQYARFYEPTLDSDYKVLTRILHLFDLILEKEASGRKLVQKPGVIGKFLDVFTELQQVHSFECKDFARKLRTSSNDLNIIDLWGLESKIFSITEKLMKHVGHFLETEGWDQHAELFLIDWGERVKQSMEQHQLNSNIRLNLPLQRSLIAYIQYSIDRIEADKIQARLEYIRRSCPDAIEHLIGQSLETIGLMRRTMIQLGGNNVDAHPVVEKYFIHDGLSYFDYDFIFVQLFSLLLHDDETNIFELFYKNYLGNDSELIELFEGADFTQATEQQMMIFEDLLAFLVQLLHGEIPFFNVFCKSPFLTDHSSKKTLDQIHRKILITFLHKTYQFSPIANLKQDFRFILRGDIFHEKILKDIADIDKSSKNFKLKKPYAGLFDSFYLFADRVINEKIIYNVRATNKTPEIAELGHFSQSLIWLNTVQQRVYEGEMVEWFSKFFEKSTTKHTPLIPSVIKLIIMPLKLLEHNKKAPVSKRFKESTVIPFFGTKNFLEKLNKTLTIVEDPNVRSPLAKLINIFVPNSNIGSSFNTSIFDAEDGKSFLDSNLSMDPNQIHELLNQTGLSNMPQTKDWDDNLVCGICYKKVDLTSSDVGIPGFISRSNMNYWQMKGRKFLKPPHNADKETLRLILFLIKRYYPYAGGLNAHDIDFMEGYTPVRVSRDFYPALTSCMHYLHRSCFNKTHVKVEGSNHEYECPICKKLNNMFIGMEKVDAASRELLEEQWRKNKRFLNFLKKQSVIISMVPDPTLKFDFYNSFMLGLYPKNPVLELRPNDPVADKKILMFTNLMRASFFQLVRNSLINDFETFMSKSYMCYKFAFVNLQSFIMKNIQFHQFFENFNKELQPTIFHILNHRGIMEEPGTPSMEQVYAAFTEALGLEQEAKLLKRKEAQEKRNLAKVNPEHKHDHHEHGKRLPTLPAVFPKPKVNEKFEMTVRNKRIIKAYDYKNSKIKLEELRPETLPSLGDLNASLEENLENGRTKGSAPEENTFKEEDLYDTLEKMILLLENETEEEFLMAFWETFLRFLVTNRMKDFHTNLDLNMLPVDFLYLRTLSIFGRTLISENVIKQRQSKLPEFEEICEVIANNAALRSNFVEEMITLSQRIVVSCVLVFDFDKCLEIANTLDILSGLKGDRENFLNHLLGMIQKDLTVDTILSKNIWSLSRVYENFFYVWRQNLTEFMRKTRNPFEMFVKNVVEIKPLVVNLPSNFNEFNSEYLPKKCDVCDEFCDYCRTVLCLLCGKIMCKEKCTKQPAKKVKKNKKKAPTSLASLHLTEKTETDEATDDSVPGSMNLPSNLTLDPPATDRYSHKQPKSMTGNINGHKPIEPSIFRTPRQRLMTIDHKPRSTVDILTMDGDLKEEINTTRYGKLSPIFQPKDFVTPKKNKPTEMSQFSNEAKRTTMSTIKKERDTSLATSLQTLTHSDSKLRAPPKKWHIRTPGSVKLEKINTPVKQSQSQVEVNSNTSLDRIQNTEATSEKKKKKKVKRGNMHTHATECHKGHTVFIDIQNQNIILYSKPREVVYPEKLYVDRFGQELKDKINILDEDWNSFELNSLVLKRLREAVENHSLPQLIYLIIQHHYKPKANSN